MTTVRAHSGGDHLCGRAPSMSRPTIDAGPAWRLIRPRRVAVCQHDHDRRSRTECSSGLEAGSHVSSAATGELHLRGAADAANNVHICIDCEHTHLGLPQPGLRQHRFDLGERPREQSLVHRP